MTIRISLGTVLIALVLVATGAGTAVGVMLWEPWDGNGSDGNATVEESLGATAGPTASPKPTATPYQKKLTGAEAAAIVRTEKNKEYIAPFLTPTTADAGDFLLQLDSCEAVDFNETARAWIVECEGSIHSVDTGNESPLSLQTFRLYDDTEKIEQVIR